MDNITKNDIQQGRTMGWHGKTDVKPDLTLENCWLRDWDYLPQPLEIDGKPTPFFVLRVTDNAPMLDDNGDPMVDENGEPLLPLMVGNSYSPRSFKPLTNARLLEVLDEALAGQDLYLDSCGTVRNRGRQFLSFELGDTYRAAGREFKPFYNVGNGNDRSAVLWENVSATCTVCDNTFQWNMADAGMIMSVKKTKFSDLKLKDFGAAITGILNEQKKFAGKFEELGLAKLSEDSATEFFAGFLGKHGEPLSTKTRNTIEKLVALFKHGKGNEGNDFADLFSAITDYYTHEAASGKDDEAAKWKNFVSSEFGSGSKIKSEAWDVVTNAKMREGMITVGRDILRETDRTLRLAGLAK